MSFCPFRAGGAHLRNLILSVWWNSSASLIHKKGDFITNHLRNLRNLRDLKSKPRICVNL